MIWLTWRQARAQVAVLAAAVAVLAILLVVTGPALAELARANGAAFLSQLGGTDSTLYVIGAIGVLVVPAVIGMFWGAPLITRELEAGTHRLIWQQSVTRSRWLAGKLGVTGLTASTAAGLLSLAVSWWAHPVDAAADTGDHLVGFYFPRLTPGIFDARGVVPIGYAAFGFALGVAVGALLRRTLPALATTLAAFVVVRIAVLEWIRPHLLTPETLTTAITAQNFRNLSGGLTLAVDRPGVWVTAQRTVDLAGNPVAPPKLASCLGGSPDQIDHGCFRQLSTGYRQVISYLPAERFWSLQLSETAIFLALALLLTGITFWWVRNRLS